MVDVRCMLCKGPMRLWLSAPVDCKKGTANPFSQTYWCDDCGYGAVAPLPAESDIASFYKLDRYYTHGRGHLTDGGVPSTLDRLRLHLAWRVDFGRELTVDWFKRELPPGSSVCDLGCGAGEFARVLAREAFLVTGVEPDEKAIAGNDGQIEMVRASAETCVDALRGRRFDAVLMSHVLEHCRDPLAALRNAARLLVPGGLLVCEVPNNAAIALKRTGAAWEMFDVPRHLHFLTEHSLVKACIHEGFALREVYYCGFCREMTNDWIATEARIWQLMPQGPKPSKIRAWGLLARAAFTPRRFKYDSVRVVMKAV